jgi:thiamine phosphate synthase YjbQ (UPF0047 family)
VFINDNESGLLHDYEVWLEKLAPEQVFYGEFDGKRKIRVLVKIIGE